MTAFDPVAATATYVATMSPAALAKAIAYTHEKEWLLVGNVAVNVVVSFLILKSGILRRIRDRMERTKPRPVSTSLLLPLIFLIFSAALSLPWDIWSGWWVEKSFGMTSQPLLGWFQDHAKGLIIGTVAFTLFLWILYAIMRRAKGAWPLWGGLLVGVFAIVGFVLGPVYIEPMFNKYTPAPNGAVRDTVVAMAKQVGVPSDKIFIYDGSKQSNRYTANVSGLFGTARVAMSDVMFKQNADIAEVKGVVGHEMGHYVRQHGLWGTLIVTILAVIVFWLTAMLFPLFSRLMGGRGVKGIADPAGVPVLMVALGVVQLLATPVTNSLTRFTEHDADNFSITHFYEPDGLSKALIKTADYRAPQPGKLEEIIFYDHPSVSSRVRFAMDWKAKHLALAEKTAADDAAIEAASKAQAPPAPAAPAPAVASTAAPKAK
jgi:STE24 endopeptidase